MAKESETSSFEGKDVATALGHSNTRDALSKHVDAEDKGTVAIRDTAYETRVTLINESGLYSLILSSKLLQAKAFKRWVTAEVLPQTARHGHTRLPMGAWLEMIEKVFFFVNYSRIAWWYGYFYVSLRLKLIVL